MFMQRRSPRSLRHRGFTLVELLVVIGIIALLISILLPTLNKARQQANTVKCMSNMRQLAFMTTLFASEHNGYFPDAFYDTGPNGGLIVPGGDPSPALAGRRDTGPWNFTYPYDSWQTIYFQYYLKNKNVFQCPSDASNLQYGTYIDQTATMWASYVYNESNNADLGLCLKLTQYRDPTRSILYAERNTVGDVYAPYPNAIVATWEGGPGKIDMQVGPLTTANIAYDRHGGNKIGSNQSALGKGKANYAFADGHVETLAWSTTWQSIGQPVTVYGGAQMTHSMWKHLGLPSPNFYNLIFGQYSP